MTRRTFTAADPLAFAALSGAAPGGELSQPVFEKFCACEVPGRHHTVALFDFGGQGRERPDRLTFKRRLG